MNDDIKDTTVIGKYLRKYRLKAGLSKSELARRIGVSRQLISRWEDGVTENISLPYLIAMMNAMDVDVKITFSNGVVNLEERER